MKIQYNIRLEFESSISILFDSKVTVRFENVESVTPSSVATVVPLTRSLMLPACVATGKLAFYGPVFTDTQSLSTNATHEHGNNGHITLVLRDLHWLTVRQLDKVLWGSKLALHAVYKSLHGLYRTDTHF